METVYFLIFIGICGFAVLWATRRSKSQIDLSAKNKSIHRAATAEKLERPMDNRLSHREQIWESRRTRTSKGYEEHKTYVPKSLTGGAPEYDGYSRRDRHHLTPSGHVKEKTHFKDKAGLTMKAMKFESEDYPSQTKSA